MKNNNNYKNRNSKRDFRKPEGKKPTQGDCMKRNPKVTQGPDSMPKSYKLTGYDGITSNDPKYYNKLSEAYNQVTQIPFIQTFGRRIPIKFNKLNEFSFPGIMAIETILGPGWASNDHDPVNRAFTKMMADLYARTSASTLQFDIPDLAMMVVSASNIAAIIGHAKRILSATRFWITRNVFYPKALVKSLGYDYDEIIGNMATYKVRLNALIRQFNNMGIPDAFDIFKRQYALMHNVYVDEDSDLGQIYVFYPSNYFIYNDKEFKCEFHYLDEEGISTFGDLLDIIENMLNAWYKSQDFYYIVGTIQRAFKDNANIHIDEWTTTDDLNPIVDEYIMMQVMNSVPRNVDTANGTQDITQNPEKSLIIWKPSINSEEEDRTSFPREGHDSMLLRVFKRTPSSDDIMEMTRLTNFARKNNNILELESCGPEIVRMYHLFYFKYKEDNTYTIEEVDPTSGYVTNVLGLTSVISITDAQHNYLLMQNFRYIPTVYYSINSGDDYVVGVLGDIYNYTTLSWEAFKNLQYIALESLYQTNLPSSW